MLRVDLSQWVLLGIGLVRPCIERMGVLQVEQLGVFPTLQMSIFTLALLWSQWNQVCSMASKQCGAPLPHCVCVYVYINVSMWKQILHVVTITQVSGCMHCVSVYLIWCFIVLSLL